MNFYEKEMRNMFESKVAISDKVFTGKTMLAKLDDEKLLKIEFVSTYVKDQYNAILLQIINKNDGLIDKQTIKFSDVVGMYNRGNGIEPMEHYMWVYNNKPEWYTQISNFEKNQIADKVMEYAEMFQDVGIKNANMFL